MRFWIQNTELIFGSPHLRASIFWICSWYFYLVVGSYPKGCPSTTFLNSSSNGTKSSEVSLTFLYLNYYLLANRFADSGLTIMLIDLQSFFFSDTDARRRSLRELGTVISGIGYVPLNVGTVWKGESGKGTKHTQFLQEICTVAELKFKFWRHLYPTITPPGHRQVSPFCYKEEVGSLSSKNKWL